ncbi:MAG: alpha/beta fold hydrolase [Alphaproteobacteria bacterium]|nr:alpha/beta fold hydrolase [Alphaproteobacteria bacterium]
MPPNSLPAPEIVEVDGLSIPMRRLGAGGAIPAVLVHGFGSDLNTWAAQHPELARDRAVYALDLPAHGGASLQVPEQGLPGYAAFLDRFLATLGLERVHVVGISMGGAVCLAAALDHPVRISSVSCINSAGLGDWVNHDAGETYFRAADRESLRAALAPYFKDVGRVDDASLDAVLARKARPGMVEGLRRVRDLVFDGDRQRHVFTDRLGDLTMPLQILWGTADRILPVSQVAGLADRYPVHLLEDSGHNPLFEEPGRVARLLRAFFHHVDRAQ